MSERSTVISGLLSEMRAGSSSAQASLMDLVYKELKRLASSRMRGERENHTLQTTAVVHEAYLRLAGGSLRNVNDRHHFFALAAKQMRFVLVDYARARAAERRDGGVQVELLDKDKKMLPVQMDVLTVHEALERLEGEHPRAAQVVEAKFFGGYTDEEIAENLEIALITVRRDWTFARAWLMREFSATTPPVIDSRQA